MSEDWDCDGGIWGSGSGGEGGFRHTDHGRGGLSDGGEGQGTGHQPDFRWASKDGNFWSEAIGSSHQNLKERFGSRLDFVKK